MTLLNKPVTQINRSPRKLSRAGVRIICSSSQGGPEEAPQVLCLSDVSQMGLRVIAEDALEIGTHLNLQIIVLENKFQIECRAEVVWACPNEEEGCWIGLRLERPLSNLELRKLTEPDAEQEQNEENSTIHWPLHQKRLVSDTNREACLVRIYPTGTEMGMRHFLSVIPLHVGREQDCEIYIRDQAVSRRHARIQPVEGGFEVIDLDSTNGTFVNNTSIKQCLLNDGDYLQIGSCIYRFLAGGNVEADYHEEIYRLTISDALTNLANKRFLVEFLERELARSRRYIRPLALIMFDLDHFKKVNDELGHLAGDFTLREMAARIKAKIRKEELFARYGGEEFAVVLPETTLQNGVRAAERIRLLAQQQTFEFDGKTFQLTISGGVVSTSGEEWLCPEEILRRADEKLYEAKKQGRNCVVF